MMLINTICGILVGIILVLVCLIFRYKWKKNKNKRTGKKGERLVASELKSLRRKEAIVFNDVLLSLPGGRTAQVDHIVISRAGIFVIETKNFTGRISGYEHAQYWTRHLSSQSYQFYNPMLQNRTHIRTLRRVFKSIDEDAFISVIVFTDTWRLDVRADDIVEPRRFLSDRHVKRTFIPAERRPRHWWNRRDEVRLDENNIVLTSEFLVDEIRRRKKIFDRHTVSELASLLKDAMEKTAQDSKKHEVYAQFSSNTAINSIRQGICPRCGGRLRTLKNDRGEFVGCSNFPECRFTCSVDRLH